MDVLINGQWTNMSTNSSRTSDRSNWPYFQRIVEARHAKGDVGPFAEHVHWGLWMPSSRPSKGRREDELGRGMDRMTDHCLELAALTPETTLLDVGCGFGGSAERAAQCAERGLIVGINVDT